MMRVHLNNCLFSTSRLDFATKLQHYSLGICQPLCSLRVRIIPSSLPFPRKELRRRRWRVFDLRPYLSAPLTLPQTELGRFLRGNIVSHLQETKRRQYWDWGWNTWACLVSLVVVYWAGQRGREGSFEFLPPSPQWRGKEAEKSRTKPNTVMENVSDFIDQ